MTDKFQVFTGFPLMEEIDSYVHWDQFAIKEGEQVIGTDGVGSCLVITMFDVQRKKGALAHIGGWLNSPENLKPENVIDTLLHGLSGGETSDYQNYEATLSGEGSIFMEDDRISPIVRAKLHEYKIPIIGEDLSKAPGRLVFLYCDTGQVNVYRS